MQKISKRIHRVTDGINVSFNRLCIKSLQLSGVDDNHTCGLLLRPSPDKSDAAMVFSLPISTSMSDSVSPEHSIFKFMFSFTFQRTWVSAPLVVVPVNCSQCQVVQSIGAKIWITPEILLRYLLAATSRPPFSIAWLVELFRDLAPSLHS